MQHSNMQDRNGVWTKWKKRENVEHFKGNLIQATQGFLRISQREILPKQIWPGHGVD